MAKIIGLKERQEALTEIQLSLKSLLPLNSFLEDDNPTHEYVISFASHKAKIKSKEKEKINALVEEYKKSIVSEILNLAESYEIELDDEEYALMGVQQPEATQI